MSKKPTKSTLKIRPFGAKAGDQEDRFKVGKGQGVVIVTREHRKRFGSKLTAEDLEFIRRAEEATNGCAALVGRTRQG